MSCVIGVDVGATKIAAAVIDGVDVRESVERSTDLSGGEGVLAGIAATVSDVGRAAGGRPDAVGVGLPSQIEFGTGTVISSVNIPLEGVPVREVLERRLGVPVFVDNDGNVAALAEAQMGQGVPATHLVMLTLGTGVGGGIITDGRIERGHAGLGAELGHLVIDGRAALDAAAGDFPRPGSLEWLCSGTGLERAANRAAEGNPAGALGRLHAADGHVSGRDAVIAAQAGDGEALAVFDRLGRWLGLGVAGLINTFQPQRIALGGGLSRAADLFLEPARREAERNSLPALWERAELDLAIGGSDAGMIGAGVLADQELQRTRDTAVDSLEPRSTGRR